MVQDSQKKSWQGYLENVRMRNLSWAVHGPFKTLVRFQEPINSTCSK